MFDDGDGPTSERCSFAVSAWRIAQSPIMVPGYVRTQHPRVLGAEAHWDDEHRVALTVQVAAPPSASLVGTIDGWRWRGCEQVGSIDTRWVEPYDNDRPAILTMVSVRIPLVAVALPKPRYQAGTADTATAKRAVHAVRDLLNDQLRPILAALDDNP
jgi:hypothetical protein